MVKKVFRSYVKVLTISKSNKHFTKRSTGNFLKHNIDYTLMERQLFQTPFDASYINTDRSQINDIQFVNTILSEGFDLLLVFGSPILNEYWFYKAPMIPKVNFHLGFSPFYVGSGTLFWPFANDEPVMAGVTIHELTEDLDMGKPIKRYRFVQAEGNYYELSNMIVRHSIDEGLLHLSKVYSQGKKFDTFEYERDVVTKKYMNADLTESAINLVRSKYSNTQKLDYDITSC